MTLPTDYKPVPVAVAAQIAEDFAKSRVVILSYDPAHELAHVTTYGTTAQDKVLAAQAGDCSAVAIGCDLTMRSTQEDFRAIDQAKSALLLQEAYALLGQMMAEDNESRSEASAPCLSNRERQHLVDWRERYAALQTSVREVM